MAVTTSQLLVNGNRWVVYKLTCLIDVAGDEANALKVDASPSGPLGYPFQGVMIYPGVHLALTRIKFSIGSMAVRLQWQATANVDMLVLQQSDHWDFLPEQEGFGGLVVPPGTPGATGSVLLSTLGSAVNSSYSLVMTFAKNSPTGP